MRHSQQGRFRQQVNFLRRQFLQEGKLPFTDVSLRTVSRWHWKRLSSAGRTECLAARTGSAHVNCWAFVTTASPHRTCSAKIPRDILPTFGPTMIGVDGFLMQEGLPCLIVS